MPNCPKFMSEKETNMFDLKCKREGCKYNKNCFCSAKKITIGKSAECKSYEASEDAHKQEKSKIKQRAVRNNTFVDCSASGCIFNADLTCIANGITVATLKNQCPQCCTIKVK